MSQDPIIIGQYFLGGFILVFAINLIVAIFVNYYAFRFRQQVEKLGIKLPPSLMEEPFSKLPLLFKMIFLSYSNKFDSAFDKLHSFNLIKASKNDTVINYANKMRMTQRWASRFFLLLFIVFIAGIVFVYIAFFNGTS